MKGGDPMDFEVFVTPGLGDNSYLVRSGDEAVIVDPQRDAWRFLAAAERLGVHVRAVLETHVHNDYVSGAHEIRAATGATLVLPARGRYEFAYQGAEDGYELAIGDLRLVAMATPGHTPEHLSWLAVRTDADQPDAVLTGGSLLVGTAGRTDLLGPTFTDELTRAQYESLSKLAELPEDVQVLPTHGAGSFCVAAMPTTKTTSTIGDERRRNLLVRAGDFSEFSTELRSELMAYPAYYAHMAPINRAGAAVLGRLPQPPAVAADAVEQAIERGAWVVDARDRETFAEAHIPGSVNVELNSGFAAYVGWLLPFDAPLLLVLPEPADESLTEALTQLIRIGWTQVDGYLEGGFDGWRRGGGPVASYELVSAGDLCEAHRRGDQPYVVDVRQELEWAWGTIPDSHLVFLADLPEKLDELPEDKPVWLICSNGHRASIAASLLDRQGVPVRLVGVGGVSEWRVKCRSLEAAKV
jgi:glyoxylase-like metal-dependent hydrolase (beta-lactamase superfamily II)/rhodanese-related sulfurtransferase